MQNLSWDKKACYWAMACLTAHDGPSGAGIFNNNNNNNTYIALIRMRSKRFTSIVLQYDLEI